MLSRFLGHVFSMKWSKLFCNLMPKILNKACTCKTTVCLVDARLKRLLFKPATEKFFHHSKFNALLKWLKMFNARLTRWPAFACRASKKNRCIHEFSVLLNIQPHLQSVGNLDPSKTYSLPPKPLLPQENSYVKLLGRNEKSH